MASPSDRVQITTKKSTEEGILIPSSEKNVVLIKLDNGYNMGFEKKDIKSTKVLKKSKTSKSKKQKITKKKSLPTIAILHTGGTIASKVDYSTGGVSAKFTARDLISMFPESS